MSLQNEIKSYFDRAAALVYDGPSVIHPIITLNALKNIIGDNRNNPSQKLLDEMAKVVESYPERIDDQAILDRVAKNGLGQTVFISDLEDACQNGNPLEMEYEAAHLQWISENGLGVLEALIEVALQDFDRLGTFSYHLQRANVFNQEIKNTWTYTRCLLKEIVKSPLPEPHAKVEIDYKLKVSSKKNQVTALASAGRLWEGDYIRIKGIRRELSYWLSSASVEMGTGGKIMNGLEDYVKKGGNFFIEMAEGLISNLNHEAKIIQLEALRYFVKNSIKSDLPVISKHLEAL
ncbi:MAG: hypothetical protein CMG10_03065 [Candidatus Marinimicrobia bacterium]|nr:hypothetical protein [Candidatus Neomarinimicrobiota bacterium]